MPTEARTNPPGDEERMPLIARPQPPSLPSSEARGGLSASAALTNVTHLASSIISPQQTSAAASTLQSTANAALASAAHAASNLVASHTSSTAPAGGSKPAQTASAALNNVAALIAPAPASSSSVPPPPAPTTSTLAATVVPELVALAANTVANKPTAAGSGAQTTPATIAASVAPQVMSLASNAITNLSTPSTTAPASATSAAVASVASVATSLLNPNPSASYGYANYGSINTSLPVSSNAAYVEPVAAFQLDAANSYASTKTFAKGFLDLSLLTSNLSLLKIYAYNAHAQSRIMMLILIIISISINVASALMSLILFFQKPDGEDVDSTPTRGVKWRHYGKHTQRINTALAVMALLSIVINAVITAFANTKTITP